MIFFLPLLLLALAGTDGVGPDTKHPHHLKNVKIWEVHYGLRAQLPTMLVEDVLIHRAAYGIYRPWFKDHVYRNLTIEDTNTEPFNRGQDDDSLQNGKITVDGLTFINMRSGGTPLIQISDDNATGDAESHFRNLKVETWKDGSKSKAIVNLGSGPRPQPKTPKGVPIYIHDYYGPGEHAKVVSTRSPEYKAESSSYVKDEPLTGNESRAARVKDVPFPKLLNPVDDLPPATVILSIRPDGGKLTVRGVSTDNGDIATVTVNGQKAKVVSSSAGVVDWQITVPVPGDGIVTAQAGDAAGNAEQMAHRVVLGDSFLVSRVGSR